MNSSKRNKNTLLIFDNNQITDEKCLLKACHDHNIGLIKKILDMKIIPTQDAFNACLEGCWIVSDYGYKKGKYGKYASRSNKASTVAIIFDMLATYGYIPTYEDLLNAHTCGCYINEPEKYGIKFDERYAKQVSELQLNLYENIPLKYDIEVLREECKKRGNVPKIKQIVNQGIEPDSFCLENACSINSNAAVIRYLVTVKKVEPTNKCFKNMRGYIRNVNFKCIVDSMAGEPATEECDPTESEESEDSSSDEEDFDSPKLPKKKIVRKQKN